MNITDSQFNAISHLTSATKLDSTIDIAWDGTGDFFVDFEENKKLTIKEGLEEIADAIAYPLAHDVSSDEAIIIVDLFSKYEVYNPMYKNKEDYYQWLLQGVE